MRSVLEHLISFDVQDASMWPENLEQKLPPLYISRLFRKFVFPTVMGAELLERELEMRQNISLSHERVPISHILSRVFLYNQTED